MTPHKAAFVQHVFRTLADARPVWTSDELRQQVAAMSETRDNEPPYRYEPILDYPCTAEEAWAGLMDPARGWKAMGRSEP